MIFFVWFFSNRIRKNARERAAELMRQGNHTDANKFLRRCVDITHEMALQLIQRCRAMNVDCIVAPYEADAQLAYLNKVGLADYIITEDSDLTLFGCQQILFKLDLAGNCVLVNAEKFHLAMDCPINKFTMDKFRLMCILSVNIRTNITQIIFVLFPFTLDEPITYAVVSMRAKGMAIEYSVRNDTFCNSFIFRQMEYFFYYLCCNLNIFRGAII